MNWVHGCRARIRTWAKGFKVLRATTTQLGIVGAEGRTRTDTEVTPQQFLRLARLPDFATSAFLLLLLFTRELSLAPTGRSGRIRTRDQRFWRPLLYQLSYT